MNTSNGQRISVCLLTYNHAHVIESTLKSILNQTITGYEVIVSDDCSTDGTWERILDLSKQDLRIKAVRTPRNLGMPGNANLAVMQSSRPYVALLHHDDLYRADLLEKWADFMERYPDIAFVFNAYGLYESASVCAEAIPPGRVDGRWLLERCLFANWGCAVRGTAMIRRHFWGEVGGMRESFGLLADIDLWMRFAKRWSVGYIPEPLITVRHSRPSYYPDIYAGDQWSWQRQLFLYEIHARNRLDYLNFRTVSGRVKWFMFRFRLSLETAKWLAYAIARRRCGMIKTADQSVTSYDQVWLRAFRFLIRCVATALPSVTHEFHGSRNQES